MSDVQRFTGRWIGRLDHELISSMRVEDVESIKQTGRGRLRGVPQSAALPVVTVPVDDHLEAQLDGIVLTLIEHAIVPASPLVQTRMGTDDESVAMIEQMGALSDNPLFVRVTYRRSADLPGVIRVEGKLAAADGAPSIASFAQRYGRPLGRSLTAIEAVRPDKRTAVALRVPPGVPMLVRELLLEDIDGIVRELSFTHFRSDRVTIADF